MNYRDLDVFKKSHELVLSLYGLVKKYPREENYRLVDQIIRAGYSIPSNIAEGSNRNTTKDYINFLYMARGSLSEVQYFLLLSKDVNYISEKEFNDFDSQCNSIGKLLNALIKSLKRKL